MSRPEQDIIAEQFAALFHQQTTCPTVNRRQAEMIWQLLRNGVQAGPDDAEPIPEALILIAPDPREPQPGPDPDPDGHTVVAVDALGRAWSVVTAGIAWPWEHNAEIARRQLAADDAQTGE